MFLLLQYVSFFNDNLLFNVIGNLNCRNIVYFPMGLNEAICILNGIKGFKNISFSLLNHSWQKRLLTTDL